MNPRCVSKKYNYNTDVFYKEDALSYYLLGVLMTDGNLCSTQARCTISSADKEWLEDIKNIICPELTVKLVKNSNKYDLVICSTLIYNWLKSKGCTPNKTLTLRCPTVPAQYITDFIRGAWDGDGTITYGSKFSNAECHLIGGSSNFIEGVQQYLFAHLNINSKLEKSPPKKPSRTKLPDGTDIIITPKNPSYRLRIRKQSELIKLLDKIYVKNDSMVLNRKRLKAIALLKYLVSKSFGDPTVV